MRRASILIVAASLAAGLSACSTSSSTSSTANLTVATVGVTFDQNLNIYAPSSPNWWWAAGGSSVYEPLVRYNAQAGGVQPWLAKSWDFSNGGKTVTLHLRDDVTFSDKVPMTSADVVFTMNMLADPAFAYGAFWTSVTAPDTDTVVIDSDTSMYATLGARLSYLWVLPKHIWEKQSDPAKWLNPKPIGTGPVVLQKATTQQFIYKVRSDYWGGALPVKRLTFVTGSVDSVLARLTSGEIDYANYGLWPAGGKTKFLSTKTNTMTPVYGNGVVGIAYNTREAPLDNAHLRVAINNAIDMSAVSKAEGANSPVSTAAGLPFQLKDYFAPELSKPAAQNTAKAKSEFAASGFAVANGVLTKNGKSYTPTIMAQASGMQSLSIDGASLMAQQVKDVLGFTIEVQQADSTKMSDALTSHDFNVLAVGTGVVTVANQFAGFVDPKTSVSGLADAKLTDLSTKLQNTDPASDAYRQLGIQAQDRAVEIGAFGPGLSAVGEIASSGKHWTNWEAALDQPLYPNPSFGTELELIMKKIKPASK